MQKNKINVIDKYKLKQLLSQHIEAPHNKTMMLKLIEMRVNKTTK